jgi:hypothetical protein
MKRLLLLISMTLIASTSFGQWLGDDFYTLNFEDTSQLHHLQFDSLTNQNNLWQVGSPQKIVFTSAYSSSKAILTDTMNTYPINDTSSFQIVNLATGYGWMQPNTVILSGYYQVNSDTLTDFGTIEVSPDNGTTWIDLVNDTIYTTFYQWWTPKPILSGNSNGWQQFQVFLAQLGPLFNVQYNDTIRYRFTFISDSMQTNKDGLMFDNFHFEDWAEGISEIQNDNLLFISPNPTSDELYIHRTNSDTARLQILNYTGEILYDTFNFNGETIITRQLANGIYLLKYSEKKYFSTKYLLYNIEH